MSARASGTRRALANVSLEIPRGSFTTFLGPSGCGKTTLLRTIAGFCSADTGSISIDGRQMNDVPSHLRGAVMVFQDYALFPAPVGRGEHRLRTAGRPTVRPSEIHGTAVAHRLVPFH